MLAWVISFKRWLRRPIGVDLLLHPHAHAPPANVSVVAFHGDLRSMTLALRRVKVGITCCIWALVRYHRRVVICLDTVGHCQNPNVCWLCVHGGFDLVVYRGDIR